VPAYWVALTVVALVLGVSEVFTPRGVLTYYGFLQIYDKETIIGGIGPAWTLCIEVTFYAALPLWAWLVRRAGGPFLRSELGLLAGVVALSVGWKALVVYVVPADTPGWLPAQVSLPAFADHFAVGMALAVVSVAGVERLAVPSWLPWALAAAAFALLAGGVPGQGYESQSLGATSCAG
jgi:peptidoglycan/LPS O-acetylase OafA/YrhL